MYYEINVALNGKHFFATAERSLSMEWEAKEMYELFKIKFPKSEGYDIMVTRIEKVGYPCNWN